MILYADLYGPETSEPLPVLLVRTPYGRDHALTSVYAHPAWYARHGYLVAVQDVRGRWSSEGEWYPFVHERADGYDSVEWAAGLPGANGRVGMYGVSYGGATQILAAVEAPPSLTCIAPAMTASDFYDGWTYRGGALQLAFVEWWALLLAQDTARRRGLLDLEAELFAASNATGHLSGVLPLKDFPLLRREGLAPWFFDWLDHASRDEYWERWDADRLLSKVRVPALHVAGWYDIFLDSTIRSFLRLKADAATPAARGAQRLVIGPWHHSSWASFVSGWDFGSAARSDVDHLQLRWFEYWLKRRDNGVLSDPPVCVFVMGANIWRRGEEWPPAGVEPTDLYLHSGGTAASLNGDGELRSDVPHDEPADTFVYDPGNPVPSSGGRSCCRPQLQPMGPADQRPVEILRGVLIYTTEPLGEDFEVAGAPTLVLFASTSARDTDWTAKLVDVHPDGRALNVSDGILRARYRDSLSEPSLLEPERVYEYQIALGVTSNVFRAGHRIRLEVSSSNFPCYDRNLNTGGRLGEERLTSRVIATQIVFHDRKRQSRLLLPHLPPTRGAGDM